MKIRTRIATAVFLGIASVFGAMPAIASEGERHNPADAFSTAGEPVQVLAISIFGAVLLAIVLITSTALGSLFEKKR